MVLQKNRAVEKNVCTVDTPYKNIHTIGIYFSVPEVFKYGVSTVFHLFNLIFVLTLKDSPRCLSLYTLYYYPLPLETGANIHLDF